MTNEKALIVKFLTGVSWIGVGGAGVGIIAGGERPIAEPTVRM